MNPSVRSPREPLPLVRALAEECARLLGGKASHHVKRATALLQESLAAPGRRVVPASIRAGSRPAR